MRKEKKENEEGRKRRKAIFGDGGAIFSGLGVRSKSIIYL